MWEVSLNTQHCTKLLIVIVYIVPKHPCNVRNRAVTFKTPLRYTNCVLFAYVVRWWLSSGYIFNGPFRSSVCASDKLTEQNVRSIIILRSWIMWKLLFRLHSDEKKCNPQGYSNLASCRARQSCLKWNGELWSGT